MKHLVWFLVFFAVSGAASQTAIEPYVAKGDWPWVATVVRAEPASTRRVEDRVLLAHAFLAASDVNSAFCGFAAASSTSDLNTWEQWTSALVREAPESATAHYLHGDALARLQQFDSAISEFNRSLKADPRSNLARNARGVIFAVTGRYDDALLDFAAVSAEDPAFADAQINRGYLYIQQSGSATSQLKAFDAALKIRPDSTLALIGEGRAVSAAGKLIAGVDVMDKTPQSCSALDDLAGGDRRTLFAWVKTQDALEKSRKSENAGTTLDSALRGIDLQRSPQSVMRAFEVEGQLSDPRGYEKLKNTLNSIMKSPDLGLRNVVQQGMAMEESKLQQWQEHLATMPSDVQHSTTMSSMLAAGVGLKKGLGANGSFGASTTVTEKYDVMQYKAVMQDQIRQVQTNLNSLKSVLPGPGGAETFQLGEARIDLGDAPRPYHNTLRYSAPLRRSEEGK